MSSVSKISFTSSCLLLAAISTACERKVDHAPKAKVVEKAPAEPGPDPTAGSASGASSIPDGALPIDTRRSEVAFIGAKVTAEHRGTFSEFDGWVTMDADTPTGLAVTVRTASVEVGSGLLARHLKSHDFFDVDEHPTARFVSSAIEAKAEAGATHEITGTLQMVGVSNEVVFPATITVEPGAVSGVAEFAIDRKQWGIEYRGMKDDLIEDEVLLEIRLTAPRG